MNATGNHQAIASYINGIAPNRLTEGFPIFINSSTVGNYSGLQYFYNGRPYIYTKVNYNDNDAWSMALHLKHEFGHAFGLGHTYRYNGDETVFGGAFSGKDFLCDVFPLNNTGCSTTCQSTWLGGGTCPEDNRNAGNGNNCNTLSSNNIMNGGNASWTSELQQGRIHRNLHLPYNNVRFFVKEMNSDAINPWLITSNEVWDFDIQMYNDIVVKSGATLTIKCKVGMANSGRIVVERGARLIIDGGEIYPWGSNWSGIQVWGTSDKRQLIASNGLSVDHGIVSIINQGTIKEAGNAISTGKYDEFGELDWGGYFGGIIRCNGAKFINCWRAIQYLTYHNFNPINGNRIDNIGYIYNSTFETNSIFKDPTRPYPSVFVSLWAVDGVKFYGNTYKNTVTPVPLIQNKGTGFNSIDASYYIDRYKVCSIQGPDGCAAYSINNPSTFTNLNYGVYVSNGTPLTNIKINDNDFVGCNRSVYIAGTYNTAVTNNRIDVGAGNTTLQYLPYGIYSDNSSAYDISNNIIKSSIGTYNTNLATGININGSNGVTNRLYRNTVNNVNVGTSVYGDNQGLNSGEGLRILCNTYGQGAIGKNQTDIMMGNFNWKNGQIDVMQGSTTLGANNLFSHNPSLSGSCLKNDFMDKAPGCLNSTNALNTFNYFFNPEPSNLTKPLYYNNSLFVQSPNTGNLNYATMCPVLFNSGTGSGGGTSSFKSIEGAKKLIALNTASVNILLAKIDGGSTQGLLNAINSPSPRNLKNLLEISSPYLSDAVLKSYFSLANIPPAHIKEIHNKNKPVSQDVWQVILNLNLPPAIMKDLTEQQSVNQINELIKLNAQIADLKQQKGFVVDETIRQVMSDSINGWNKDSIVDLMKADNRHEAECRLLAAYVALDKLPEAVNQITVIKNEHAGMLDDFCKVQELILQLRQQSKTIVDIRTDVTKRQLVEQIERDKTDAGYVNAQALLKNVFNYTYYEYISLPNEAGGNSSRMLNNTNDEIIEAQTARLFKIYPNPANSSVIIQFTSEQNYNAMQIMIYDITGKMVIKQDVSIKDNLETININSLTTGMYLVTMVADGKVIEKQKLIKE